MIMETPGHGSWDRARSRHDAAFRAHVEAHLAAFARQAIPPGDRRPAAVAAVLLPDDEGRRDLSPDAPGPGPPRSRRTVGAAGRPDRSGGERFAAPPCASSPRRSASRSTRPRCSAALDDYPDAVADSSSPPSSCGRDRPSYSSANPAEVASIHRVLLADLDAPDVPRFLTVPERERPVVQLPLLGTLIHAPTAAILYQLREVILHGRTTRVSHLEEPVWKRR